MTGWSSPRHTVRTPPFLLESRCSTRVVVGHDLDRRSRKVPRHQEPSLRRTSAEGREADPFNKVEIDRAPSTAAKISDLTLQLHQEIWPRLEALPRLKNHMQRSNSRWFGVGFFFFPFFFFSFFFFPFFVTAMERAGVLVDRELRGRKHGARAAHAGIAKRRPHIEAGEAFNGDIARSSCRRFVRPIGDPVTKDAERDARPQEDVREGNSPILSPCRG